MMFIATSFLTSCRAFYETQTWVQLLSMFVFQVMMLHFIVQHTLHILLLQHEIVSHQFKKAAAFRGLTDFFDLIYLLPSGRQRGCVLSLITTAAWNFLLSCPNFFLCHQSCSPHSTSLSLLFTTFLHEKAWFIWLSVIGDRKVGGRAKCLGALHKLWHRQMDWAGSDESVDFWRRIAKASLQPLHLAFFLQVDSDICSHYCDKQWANQADCEMITRAIIRKMLTLPVHLKIKCINDTLATLLGLSC